MATRIYDDKDINTTISSGEHWYYVIFEEDGKANFFIDPDDNLDVDIYVYDNNQTTILGYAKKGLQGKSDLISQADVKGGRLYYIEVKHYSGEGNYLLRCKNYPVSTFNHDLSKYYINQGDPNFKDITFKNDTRIGKYGCGVCSVAMIICFKLRLTDVESKISVVKKVIADSTDSNGDLTYSDITYNSRVFNCTRNEGSNIGKEVLKKQPIVCHVPGHFVVLTGHDSNKSGYEAYSVKDPGDRTKTNLQQTMNKYKEIINKTIIVD